MPHPEEDDLDLVSEARRALNPDSEIDLVSEARRLLNPERTAIQYSAEKFIEAAPDLNVKHVAAVGRQAGRIVDPQKRSVAFEQLQSAGQPIKQGIRAGAASISQAKKAGDIELTKEAKAAMRVATGKDPRANLKAAKERQYGTGLPSVLGWLDAPHHGIRRASMKTLINPELDIEDRHLTNEEWLDEVEKTGVGKALLSAFGAAFAVNPVTQAQTAIGALTGEGLRDASRLGLTMATDPTSYVGGTTKQLTRVAGPVGRLASKLGVSDDVAQQAARVADEILSKGGGTKPGQEKALRAIKEEFEQALGSGSGEKVAKALADTFGSFGEMLGKSQFRFSVPGIPDKGFDVLPALGAPEFSGTKHVMQPAAQKIGGAIGRLHPELGNWVQDLQDPLAQFAKTRQRQARAQAKLAEQAEIGQVTEGGGDITKELIGDVRKRAADDAYLAMKNRLWNDLEGAKRKGDQFMDAGQFSADESSPLLGSPFFGGIQKGAKAVGREKTQMSLDQKLLVDIQKTKAELLKSKDAGRFDKLDEAAIARLTGKETGSRYSPLLKRDLGAKQPSNVELVDSWAREAEKVRSRGGFGESLRESFGEKLPPQMQRVLDATFDEALLMAKMTDTPVGRAVAKAMNSYKVLALVTRPGYHAVNIMNDSVQMVMGGMRNPAKWLKTARDVIKAARDRPDAMISIGGKRFKAGSLLKKAQENGVAIDSTRVLDLSDQGGSLPKFLEHPANPTSYMIKGGKKFAGYWEDTSKLAMYLYGIKVGDSPANAAKRSFDTLIDYSDSNKALRTMKMALPFATWMYKAPRTMGKMALQNPAATLAPYRVAEELQGEDKAPGPSYMTKKGFSAMMPKPAQEAYSSVRQALGGTPVDPGMPMRVGTRLPVDEAFHPFAQLLRGAQQGKLDVSDTARSIGPIPKAVYEMVFSKDLYTGQDKDISWSRLLPAPGQTSGYMEYLPQFVVDPNLQTLANYLIASRGGPLKTIGVGPRASTPQNTQDYYVGQAARMLTGLPMVETMPSLRNQAYSDEVQDLIKGSAGVKKVRRHRRQRGE